jgi:prepilin-type N-terminal cleavage/methylation domain-containing protein
VKFSPGSRAHFCQAVQARAFTMIEIMVVIGILALVLGMGAPAIYSSLKSGPMRKAITGVTEACDIAKARAILGGRKIKLTFRPQDRTFSVEGGPMKGMQPGVTGSGSIDESIDIEMLDVNLSERREDQVAEVIFFPDGTSDELTLILHSDQNRWVKLKLDPTTSTLNIGNVER